MLHDVKVRTVVMDGPRRIEHVEIITVDADGGDAAAEAALDMRPKSQVIGVAPRGGFGPVGGAALEAEDPPASDDDEDAEPGLSNRELAMARRARDAAGRYRKAK